MRQLQESDSFSWSALPGLQVCISVKGLTNTDLHYRLKILCTWIVMCTQNATNLTIWLWMFQYLLILRLKYHKKCSSLLMPDCELRCRKVDAGKTKTKYNFKVQLIFILPTNFFPLRLCEGISNLVLFRCLNNVYFPVTFSWCRKNKR